MAAVKRFVLVVVAGGSLLVAGLGISRFYDTEGPFIERDQREAQVRQAREREWAIANQATTELKGLGVVFFDLSKDGYHGIDLSGWRGSDRDLTVVARLSMANEQYYSSQYYWRIKLTGSRFNDDSMRHAAKIPNIGWLNITGSQITDDGLRELRPLAGTLCELGLNRTAVTDAGLAQLEDFQTLRTLCLTGTRVTGRGLKSLARLSNLTSLSLRATPVDDDGLANIEALVHLKFLDLESTAVTDACVTHLTKLTALEGLYAGRTSVTPECLAHLQAELPSLRGVTGEWLGTDFQ